MSELTPHEPARVDVEQYFGLVATGELSEDDRVELLEGVIVAMPPSRPAHAAVVNMVSETLLRELGGAAAVRTQCTLVLGRWSAAEPDVAAVPGSHRDYLHAHPRTALLVVEVSDTTLRQDQLSKARVYAAAGIPEYWIVNLREGRLEVLREPDRAAARYRESRRHGPGDRVALASFPDRSLAGRDLLPVADPDRSTWRRS
jgi:Uma2 family endonuclease